VKKTYLNVIFAVGTIFFWVPESRAEEIPLTKTGGVYAVPVLINEVITLNFVLDSGAAEVSIPADVALTLVRAGTVTKNDFLPGKTYVLGDGSQVKSPRFVLRSLKVGNSTVSNVVGQINNARGPLLLGQSFLEKLGPWTLNTDKQVLAIDSSAAPNSPQQVQTAPNPPANAPSESTNTLQPPIASKTTSPNDGKENQSEDCLLIKKPLLPASPEEKLLFSQYIPVLQKRIKDNWNPPKNQPSTVQTSLHFSVLKNGEMCNLKVEKSSGNSALDNEALQAARKSAPFAPLPPEYKEQNIEIRFTLAVNVKSAGDNTVQPQPATEEDKYFQEGSVLYKQKDYTGAIKSFSQAISSNSKFVKAYRARGNSYALVKDFQKALEDYTQVIRLEPSTSDAYYIRGVIYSNQKNYKSAIEDLTKAISISPNYAQAYYARGNVYVYEKDFAKSIDNYTQAIRAFPNYAKAYRARGNIYYARKDLAKTIEDYQKAAEIFQKQGQARDSQAMLDLIKQIQQSL
jgi:TonB family protein